MENSVNVVHLETKVSRLSCKDMKKQDSLRYHMFSGFLAIVEMLQALRSLWDAIFPFALLWWNVMLCATCAKYYSWNWSRSHLQMAGRRFYDEVMGESDAEEIEGKNALSFHQSETFSHIETKLITSQQSGSCTQASCGQKVDVGSCFLQQSRLSSQDCTRDMFSHEPHVNNIEMCAEERLDNEVEELHWEASVISKAHVSKALDMTLPSCSSKLFSLHSFDERVTQRSEGLLKAAYWAACPLLLPQQVAPLAINDAASDPQKSFEYLWMQSTLRINGNLMTVKAPMQVLYTAYINFSTLEEHLRIPGVSFASWISLMIHSKEHAYLARQFAKLVTSRAHKVDDNLMQFASSPFDDLNFTQSIVSSEALAETMDDLNADLGKQPSSPHLSDSDLKSDVGHTHDNDDEDVVEDIGSHDGHNGNCVNGSQSSTDLNDEFKDGDAAQIDVDDDYTPHFRFAGDEDNIADSSKVMAFFHKSSIYINDNYYDFYDRSDWDMRYDEPHWFPEVDSGYYNATDGVCSDCTYLDDCFGGDDAVRGDTILDVDAEVHGHSLDTKPPHVSDTWWDEDAVLLETQEREEDDMEQAWQVV